MGNLNLNVNLMKLSRTGVATIKGVKCLIVPIAENDIYVSYDAATMKAKSAYLSLTAWENRDGKPSQYGDTHMVKQSFSKDFREANLEFCSQSPILGNGKPFQTQAGVEVVDAPEVAVDPNSDLPF